MEKYEELIQSTTPVLIDFFATWCGPCKQMHPILEELKKQMGEHIRIIKIDVDTHEELAQQNHIQSVPTLLIYKNGEQLWRGSGVKPLEELKKLLEEAL